MASSLITSWQIDVEIMETVTDCIFLGSIITMDGDMSLSQLWEMVIDREAWRAAVWNQSVSSCLVLTGVSWPAYRFHRRQVRWSDIPISLRIFQFVGIHTCRGSQMLCSLPWTRPDCVSMGTVRVLRTQSQGRGGWLLSQEVKPKVWPQRLYFLDTDWQNMHQQQHISAPHNLYYKFLT